MATHTIDFFWGGVSTGNPPWVQTDRDIDNAIRESRKKMLDNALATAQVVALGIPIKDQQDRITGWEVPPDTSMLKYLLSTLGKDEGFNNNIDITTGGRCFDCKIEVEIIDTHDQVRDYDEE